MTTTDTDNVQDHTNSNLVNDTENLSHNICQSSLSPLSPNECLSLNQGNQHVSEVILNVDQCNDDSDSEIFRVKRRSSLKVEKRNVNGGMWADHAKLQGFKRLKKIHPEGRSEELVSSDHCASNYLNSDIHFKYAKVTTTTTTRDRCSEGITIPVSVRVKRTQNYTGKITRETIPVEIGPKRLQIKDPLRSWVQRSG